MLMRLLAIVQCTVLISLLQPPPETFALFDDIFVLAAGAHPLTLQLLRA